MSIPEDQLWSFLDDWGLPFRLSMVTSVGLIWRRFWDPGPLGSVL